MAGSYSTLNPYSIYVKIRYECRDTMSLKYELIWLVNDLPYSLTNNIVLYWETARRR